MSNDFQRKACATFKEHVPLDAHKARLLDWSSGLGGETGEVQELLKHHIFHDTPINKMEMAKELGDVLWYVAALATTMEMCLEDIMELNTSKLQHRHEQKFSMEGSHNRHTREQAFSDTETYRALKRRICKDNVTVIFVGPDGSGKTSLSKIVAEQVGFRYHKCTYAEDNKPQRCLDLLAERKDTVFDRFYWPDDIIYTNVHKGKLVDDFEGMNYLEVIEALCDCKTLFILVDADLPVLKQRSAAWADDYVSVDQLKLIRDCYDQFITNVTYKYDIPLLFIDTTDSTPDSPRFDDLVTYCVKAIEALREESNE